MIRKVIICGCLLSMMAANAGLISKIGVKATKEGIEYSGRKALKEGVEKVGRETAELIGESSLRQLKKQGDDVAEKVVVWAGRTGVDPADAAGVVAKLGKHAFAGDQLADDVVEFALRNGDGGVYLVKRFGFKRLKDTGWTKAGTERAIEEAWTLTNPRRVGGSWKKLQQEMNACGITGSTGRDFCEDLFAVRVKAGRIPGITKGTPVFDGHIGDARQGIDFLIPDKDGLLRVVEFGSGKKPSHAAEMTWERIREQLAKYIEANPDDLVRLRGMGLPAAWFNPKTLRDPGFNIQQHIQRVYYAPEFNKAALGRLGSDVAAYQLP